MTRLGAWVQASRPLAQISIAVPLVYGQALAFAAYGTFRWKLFALVHLFGLLDHLFVVYANDIADFANDAHNTTHNRYSGSSRVIPEGKLHPMQLAQAAILALLAMATVCAYLVFREQRAFMVVIAAIGAHLTWMYGFPPFRLSYRGLGEVLQGLGLGVLLPVAGFYVQAGTLTGLRPLTLAPGFLLGYAANVLASLADAPSDAAADKRTLPVRKGERVARKTALVAIAVAALGTPVAVPRAGALAWIAVMIVAAVALWRSARLSSDADSVHRERCERFMATGLGTITVVILAWALSLIVSGGG